MASNEAMKARRGGVTPLRTSVPVTLTQYEHRSVRSWPHSQCVGHTSSVAMNARCRAVTPLRTLQRTATRCNTLQHTASHRNTMQHTAGTNVILCLK